MRTLLCVLALILIPASSFAQNRDYQDYEGPKTPKEVIKEDHDALRAHDRYRHNTEVKDRATEEHAVKEHLKCKMVVTKPHHKHIRCS